MFDVKNCKALPIKQTKKLNIISKKILDDKSTNSQFITTFLQQFNAICFLLPFCKQILIWLMQIRVKLNTKK